MKRSPETFSRAFTLIELIVSMALFTIVVTIVMSSYLNLISLDRKARATNDLVSNLSFAVEGMSRSIRTGTHYNCQGSGNCSTGGSYFAYVDENCRPVQYILGTTNAPNSIGECIGSPDLSGSCNPSPVSCNANTATPITDPRANVQSFTFYAQGIGTAGADGSLQPRVLFTISGTITPDANSTPVQFNIEGGATQRLIDL